MMNRRLKKASAVLLAMTMIFSLAGCVDQSQGKKSSDSATQTESSTDETASSKTADKKTSDSKSDKDSSNEDAKSLLEINDPEEKAAVEAAKKKVQGELLTSEEQYVARWAYENGQNAGATTNHFSSARCLYFVIKSGDNVYGVIGIPLQKKKLDSYENSILISVLNECALTMENSHNAIEKEKNYDELAKGVRKEKGSKKTLETM